MLRDRLSRPRRVSNERSRRRISSALRTSVLKDHLVTERLVQSREVVHAMCWTAVRRRLGVVCAAQRAAARPAFAMESRSTGGRDRGKCSISTPIFSGGAYEGQDHGGNAVASARRTALRRTGVSGYRDAALRAEFGGRRAGGLDGAGGQDDRARPDRRCRASV